MTDNAPSRVERELTELAAALVLPPAPDLREAVRARLAQPASGRRPTRSNLPLVPRPGIPSGRSTRAGSAWYAARDRPLIRWVAVAVLAALALLALTPPGQAAAARLWQFAGVVFRDTGSAPAPTSGPGTGTGGATAPTGSAGPSLGALPGQTVSDLASARRLAAFPLHVPAALGPPDVVLVGDDGSIVSLIYRPGPGRPAPDASGISARMDEFASSEPVFQKSVGPGSTEAVVINGSPGIWVSAPHEVAYLDRHGSFTSAPPHLAGRTLIWQLGRVTLRLEGAFTRGQALDIARSLR